MPISFLTLGPSIDKGEKEKKKEKKSKQFEGRLPNLHPGPERNSEIQLNHPIDQHTESDASVSTPQEGRTRLKLVDQVRAR